MTKKILVLIMLLLSLTSCILVEDNYRGRGTRVRVRRPPVIVVF